MSLSSGCNLIDGRLLPVQEMVEELMIYPGEWYDVIVEPETAGNYQVEIEYLSITMNRSREQHQFLSV
ncbi:MAG: hypothetical protein JRE20_02045 [Deltaproteobacteria bacterium]|nr:hypothetical protein [Deltaproteobacteria bacterium]